MFLVNGHDGKAVHAPVLRNVVMSGLSFTPAEDSIIIMGGDVDITVNGVTLPVLKGYSFVVLKTVTYTFSIDTPLGIS